MLLSKALTFLLQAFSDFIHATVQLRCPHILACAKIIIRLECQLCDYLNNCLSYWNSHQIVSNLEIGLILFHCLFLSHSHHRFQLLENLIKFEHPNSYLKHLINLDLNELMNGTLWKEFEMPNNNLFHVVILVQLSRHWLP